MEVSISATISDTTTIINPRPLNPPSAPQPGLMRGTTSDDIRDDAKSLTAEDFGLRPGKKVYGQTAEPEAQADAAVREQYDRVRLETMADNDTSETGRLRKRVRELEAELAGRDIPQTSTGTQVLSIQPVRA